jgi:excisionase family DNA binding protein
MGDDPYRSKMTRPCAAKRIGSKPLVATPPRKIHSVVDRGQADKIPAWALQPPHDAKEPRDAAVFAAPDIAGRGSMSPLMTVGEAATVLRVSTRTIRRLIRRGELCGVTIGRSIRIRPQDIKRIISGDPNV